MLRSQTIADSSGIPSSLRSCHSWASRLPGTLCPFISFRKSDSSSQPSSCTFPRVTAGANSYTKSTPVSLRSPSHSQSVLRRRCSYSGSGALSRSLAGQWQNSRLLSVLLNRRTFFRGARAAMGGGAVNVIIATGAVGAELPLSQQRLQQHRLDLIKHIEKTDSW